MGQRPPDLMALPDRLAARWGWRGALLFMTVLGSALRFAALDAKTLWLDEAFSLWMAHHALPDLVAWLVQIDHHPPLYYVLLHQWIGWFGDGPSALRSLSALASSLAIPLYGIAAHRLAGWRVGMVATLLLALSPFHLRYAQETRMYGVLVLAVALLFLAVAQILASRVASWRWWLLLAVSEAAAMLTHNTATILVPLALNSAVVGAWWGQRRGWWRDEFEGFTAPRFVRTWLISQVGALLLWLPWSVAFVRQAQVVDSNFWIAPPDPWAVWMALGNLTFAHLPAWLPARDYVAWLALLLAAVGVWLWRKQSGLTWLLLALWLVPPVVELIASVRRPIFYDRTLIWTTLPYYLLIARGVIWPAPRYGFWGEAWARVWSGTTLVLVVALCALGIGGYFRDFVKEDWDEVAGMVAAHAQPQELILFHASWAELPFNYYYPATAPGLVQHGIPADLFDAGVLEPPMTEADVGRVEQLIAGQTRVWLVYSHWWYTDPKSLLPQTLAAEMEVVEEHSWPGIRVILYQQ